MNRRSFLALLGASGIGAAAGRQLAAPALEPRPAAPSGAPAPSFYGATQAGIATPQQRHGHLAAFDLASDNLEELRELLKTWSQLAAELTSDPAIAPEADGARPASLTVTLGLGPDLFSRNGRDRLGLRERTPRGLIRLPHFSGDELDTARSNGDLLVQCCANDAQVAFAAIHALTHAAADHAHLRWADHGWLPDAAGTPRNLMGFKDGTANIRINDAAALRQHVWLTDTDAHGWKNGTIAVIRRIRILFDVWDALPVDAQERAVGRHKHTGAPLGSAREFDTLNPAALPASAHVRLAAPEGNDGHRLLRRGYSYSNGSDRESGQLDAGLLFIAYQRDPGRAFVPLQHKLAQHDALSRHLQHTGSATFACPPGCQPGGFIGERLFA